MADTDTRKHGPAYLLREACIDDEVLAEKTGSD